MLDTGDVPEPGVRRRPLVTPVLTLMVAVAFADASIVALALPAIYGRFDTTVVGVSWVLTGYAVAVAVAAGLVALFRRRLRLVPLVLGGLALFAAGSLWCGLAGSLTALMTGRVVQGVGAAALLAGALEVLCGQQGRERGRRLWSGAATAGLAAGPAVGGVLTEAFDWRVIFLGQAPVAVLTLLVLAAVRPAGLARSTPAGPSVEPLPPLWTDGAAPLPTWAAEDPTLPSPATRAPTTVEQAAREPVTLDLAPLPERERPAGGTADAVWANLGYVTLFAGLVGALFLGVLMLVEVWRLTPLHAAVVMMALPAGTLITERLTGGAGRRARMAAGAAGLAAGLLALALLPAASTLWAAAALFVCGAGAGMALAVLATAALPDGRGLVGTGASVVAAKHLGLVLGLVVIAPLLAGSLEDGGRRAIIAGTGLVLDARVPAQEKVRFALAVRDALENTPRGAVPDVRAAVGEADPSLADSDLTNGLEERLQSVVTRAFRPAFGVATALALLTMAVALALRRQPRPPGPGGRALASGLVAVVVLAGAALPAAELAAGARDFGRYPETPPCQAPSDPYPGDNLDALLQRIAFGALHGAACEMNLSRERFVLALAGQPGFATVEWDQPTVERVVRAAIERAVEDARQRGDAPDWLLALIGATVRHLPLARILEAAGLPSG